MGWDEKPGFEVRLETHFGDRVVRCFRQRPANAQTMFRESVIRYAQREAAVCSGRRLSFADLGNRVERIAAGFQADGLGRGDRIALLIGTRVELAQTVFAAWRVGAVAVPIDPRLAAPEVEYILRDSGAAALVYEADLAAHLPDSARTPALRVRYAIDPNAAAASSFEMVGAGLPSVASVDIGEDDDALLVYTSGTSGRSKGVVVSHINIVHTVKHYEFAWGLGVSDRSLLAIPASNITGLVAIVLTLLHAGGCVIYMHSFKAQAFLELASAERATHAFMVPAMYKLCLLCPEFDRYDLSAWRLGSYGGAIMPTAIIEELSRRIPQLQLMNGYGATETTSPAIMLPRHLTASHSDTVGFPLPCAEICIMDPQGREMAPGEIGELWIKGPMVVRRYWNNPEETARSFVSGYWRSGDLCSKDKQGFVRFHDRLKDSINRGGYKIYSAEVENVLMQLPGIQEAAVIGRPDPVLGERVHAVVTRREPTLEVETIREFCARRLADYKVPESFTVLDEPLPRNANGKVVKRALRDQIL